MLLIISGHIKGGFNIREWTGALPAAERKVTGLENVTAIRRKNRPVPVMAQTVKGGAEFLSFPEIEKTGVVRHLMSTRLGGVSEGDLWSMNVSYSRGDRKENVDENYRRIAEALGCGMEDFVFSDQTHTTNIRHVTGVDRGKGILRPRDYTDVDGMITDEPGIVLSTFYADCVPLLFVDPVKKAVGLSHSGWKGTAGCMGRKTVEAMQEAFGSRPEDILAGIGPSICRDCYEVSKDVAEVFQALFAEDIMRKTGVGIREILEEKGNEKYQLDLWKANEAICLSAGISPEHISVTDVCTCCDPTYLFSHRASNGRRGNLGMFVVLN